MANKQSGPGAELFPVDQLRQETATPAEVHAGALIMAGWRPGKLVSRAAYHAAIKNFKAGGVKRA